VIRLRSAAIVAAVRGAFMIVALLGIAACRRSPAPPPETPSGALETDARTLLVRYDDAWMKKDVKALDRILAPDYVYFSSRGELSDHKKTRELVASPDYRLERGHRSDIHTYRVGTTVVVSTRWQGAGVFEGKPFEDDQRCSVVVGFADGKGRVLSEHCTNLPRP
jgi:ketosteroid isomerase-like protein